MPLTQIIYSSRPLGYTAGTLDDILAISRRCNTRDGITGTLICRADLYLQLIEGRDTEIQALYTRIIADDRHQDIRCHVARTVNYRHFPYWAMRDDPPRSWMWSPAEVLAGALVTATPEQMLAVFDQLAREAA